jgi:hypothetical protein
MPTIGEEDEDEDEDDARSHNDLDSVRKFEMECDHPAQFQNERDSVRNLVMELEDRRLRFEQFINVMPTIVEEDEDEDDAQSIMD